MREKEGGDGRGRKPGPEKDTGVGGAGRRRHPHCRAKAMQRAGMLGAFRDSELRDCKWPNK